MIGIERYIRFKEKGLAKVIKIDDVYYLTFKRFSVEDGSELEQETQEIILDILYKDKKDTQEYLDNINAIIQDTEKLG